MIENPNRKLNRRGLILLGGSAFALAGCQMQAPGMMGAMAGGAGKDADWASLIKSLRDALDTIADETEALFLVQSQYAEVFDLKKEAASWKGQAQAVRNGLSGVKLGSVQRQSKSQQRKISEKLDQGYSLGSGCIDFRCAA